jgi:hypothetical protein
MVQFYGNCYCVLPASAKSIPAHCATGTDIQDPRRYHCDGENVTYPAAARPRVSRRIKRILQVPRPCRYQREEYRTSDERNARLAELRVRGLCGLVKYSDMGAACLVYVVAWPIDRNVEGMAGANRETAGGRASYSPMRNLQEIDNGNSSIEISKSPEEILENAGLEIVSMENLP